MTTLHCDYCGTTEQYLLGAPLDHADHATSYTLTIDTTKAPAVVDKGTKYCQYCCTIEGTPHCNHQTGRLG